MFHEESWKVQVVRIGFHMKVFPSSNAILFKAWVSGWHHIRCICRISKGLETAAPTAQCIAQVRGGGSLWSLSCPWKCWHVRPLQGLQQSTVWHLKNACFTKQKSKLCANTSCSKNKKKQYADIKTVKLQIIYWECEVKIANVSWHLCIIQQVSRVSTQYNHVTGFHYRKAGFIS